MRVAIIGIVLLVGAVAVWLFGGSPSVANAPPGGEAAVFGAASTPREVTDSVREAFLDGKSVRVEYRPPSGDSEDRTYWSREMSDRERDWALRQIGKLITMTDEVFDLKEENPLQREKRLCDLFRIRVMAQAAQELLGENGGFVTAGCLSVLESNDEWHYWNIVLPPEDGARRSLYVPIDLRRFPDVLGWRQKANEIADFAKQDAAYEWNALDYSERKELVDEAESARQARPEIESELAAVRSIPATERSPAEVARYHDLGKRLNACYEAITKVPPHYDEQTLEWVSR